MRAQIEVLEGVEEVGGRLVDGDGRGNGVKRVGVIGIVLSGTEACLRERDFRVVMYPTKMSRGRKKNRVF